MAKYAADDENGQHAYLVETIEWAGTRRYAEIKYADSLADAKWRYGWTGQRHTQIKIRRARVEDVEP